LHLDESALVTLDHLCKITVAKNLPEIVAKRDKLFNMAHVLQIELGKDVSHLSVGIL